MNTQYKYPEPIDHRAGGTTPIAFICSSVHNTFPALLWYGFLNANAILIGWCCFMCSKISIARGATIVTSQYAIMGWVGSFDHRLSYHASCVAGDVLSVSHIQVLHCCPSQRKEMLLLSNNKLARYVDYSDNANYKNLWGNIILIVYYIMAN